MILISDHLWIDPHAVELLRRERTGAHLALIIRLRSGYEINVSHEPDTDGGVDIDALQTEILLMRGYVPKPAYGKPAYGKPRAVRWP